MGRLLYSLSAFVISYTLTSNNRTLPILWLAIGLEIDDVEYSVPYHYPGLLWRTNRQFLRWN